MPHIGMASKRTDSEPENDTFLSNGHSKDLFKRTAQDNLYGVNLSIRCKLTHISHRSRHRPLC